MQYKKIKTFEDACKALKRPTTLPVVKGLPAKHQEAVVAHYKLVTIAEAINEGWQPNWNDSDEYKYHPYFYVKASGKKPSGFGLSFDGAVSWYTTTGVGSRLCFKSRELAEYAGKKFIKLYEQAYLLMQ
jgi:hypothetical protein